MSPSSRLLAYALVSAILIAGCQTASDRPAEPEPAEVQDAPAVAPPDTSGADVWAHLQQEEYRSSWALWPGMGELYSGREPHGMLLTTYLNDVALQALTERTGVMPEGAVVVKENYRPDSTLAAITVMVKKAGYNPEHGDWFFSKHLPDGTLDIAPTGMSLEGRVPGCQNCHIAQQSNDYIFTGSLSP